VFEPSRPPHRYWLHGLLLALTFLTTTVAGVDLARSFALGRPLLIDDDWFGYGSVLHHPALLTKGLPFSLALLTILMAHEMGHYIAARYYGVDASLPYFLPAPTLIGTLGAFIRIHSPMRTKRALFDIGVAGPVAGFVALLIVLAVGMSLSKFAPGAAGRGDLIFGTPLLIDLFSRIAFPGVRSADILLHPVARAAWVGMLTTALNLLPIGQLDGGHILYSFLGERTRLLSRIFVAALLALGCYQLYRTHYHAGGNWLVWAIVLFFLALRHPRVYDSSPIGTARTWVALFALGMLILCFMVNPVRS
jgi:membrane-associated protease RseP (regulator of RpoE activity)